MGNLLGVQPNLSTECPDDDIKLILFYNYSLARSNNVFRRL